MGAVRLRSTASSRSRRFAAAGFATALIAGLAACAPDPVTQQYLEGGNAGYIASDLTVKEIPEADRGEPVEWSGTTDGGEELSSAEVAGDVVVVNFWYAACGPCRVEAPDLEAVWQDFQDEQVSFVGVNTYDQAGTARSFAEQFGITYPSIMDVDEGAVTLAFAEVTPMNATPTTLVLDSEGRVAARIIGQLDGPSILKTLVSDTLAEAS